MKVLKNNLWNNIFNKKKLQEQQKEAQRLSKIVKDAEGFIPRLNDCKDLMGMLHLHKELWGCGIQSRQIGPCKYGMFRAEDILTMKPEQVYLGDVYSLWTFPIPVWEEKKESKFGETAIQYGLDPNTTVYEIVCNQYRELLISNVIEIKKYTETLLAQY